MKSVKDISDETGVSVQTVYRRLNKVKQKSNEALSEKIDGITYFTDVGERLIIESLTSVKQAESNGKQPENAEILFLREQNKMLTEKLAALADELIKLNENNQTLLREQNLKSLTAPAPEKVSLWNRIFRKKGQP
jgi:hypothetical protein